MKDRIDPKEYLKEQDSRYFVGSRPAYFTKDSQSFSKKELKKLFFGAILFILLFTLALIIWISFAQ